MRLSRETAPRGGPARPLPMPKVTSSPKSYMGSIDFANQNQLNAASGVFLVRLDRAP